MIPRASWVSVVLGARLSVATLSHAQEAGYGPGRGGVGGQMGGSVMLGEEDYSKAAGSRFAFSGHFRYAITPWLRWQISPAFTWTGYDDQELAPFRDPNFPNDSTKANYLTLVLPMSAQLQLTMRRGQWLSYAGAGPGVYRVWIQNRRKVLEDPVSRKLHRGLYPGATAQAGIERFLKSLPNTSVELSVDAHYVFAERPEQFPSGWNSKLLNAGIRIGGNYYFTPNPPKKPDAGVPGTP